MSTYDKANDGEYKTKLPYPERAKAPAVLSKSARDLTSDEIATLGDVRSAYDAAVAAVKEARHAHNEDEARLERLFREDLEAEYGMKGHPKADKLFSLAWEHGHSSGLAEVANYYGEFAELAR